MVKPETTLNNEVLVCPARFERATYALEGEHSAILSQTTPYQKQ